VKRTTELTAVQYRRSIHRLTSAVPNGTCPVCGSHLGAETNRETKSADSQMGDRRGEDKLFRHTFPKEQQDRFAATSEGTSRHARITIADLLRRWKW
jgi:hypothetical protein